MNAAASTTPIEVEHWPSEGPLLALSVIVSLLVWIVLVFSGIGIFYIVFLGLFFLWMNLAFIGQVRGSAVKLGPNQFPELYAAVEGLAKRMTLSPMPEVYLM